MPLQIAGRTHVGGRRNNEDSYVCAPEYGLAAVADGMGGYEGGERASRITVQSLLEFLEQNTLDTARTWPFGFDRALTPEENLLRVALLSADRAVRKERHGKLAQMGSTVAAVLFRSSQVILGHAGDSRIYRLRKHQFERLTRDHSLLEEMELSGTKFPPESLAQFSHIITRAIGASERLVPELHTTAVEPGDRLLLCTDGLWGVLTDQTIAALLESARNATEAADSLVDEAFQAGASDNITAVVAFLAADHSAHA